VRTPGTHGGNSLEPASVWGPRHLGAQNDGTERHPAVSGGLFDREDLGNDRLNRWREDFPLAYRDGKPIPAVARRQRQCD
jgi:hypothetical protein